MKKMLKIITLIGLIAMPFAALADPTPILLQFVCPNTSGTGTNSLSNFGARIAGYGTLTIAGTPGREPYFTYAIPAGANIPAKINAGSYSNSGTDYDPVEAIISCSYTSPNYSGFTVKYQMTNGTGGTIDSMTANSISINQNVGMRS